MTNGQYAVLFFLALYGGLVLLLRLFPELLGFLTFYSTACPRVML